MYNSDVDRPHVVRALDRQTAQQIRIDAIYRRPNTSKPAAGHRFDPHAPHQCCDMTPADLAPLGSQ
jgi:hypothetical protein